MSFLEYIKTKFRVVVVDTEFQSDVSNTYCTKALCAVYKDLSTGQTLKIWDYGHRNMAQHHFDFEKTMFVCHYANAEVGYFLNMLMGRPPYVFDCWTELAKLYKSRWPELSLLAAARAYEFPHPTSTEEKEYFRDMCIKQNTWTENEREKILNYCEKDVLMSEHVFYGLLKDLEKTCGNDYETLLEQALERGQSMACVASVLKNGMPVDVKQMKTFNDYWPLVKDSVIQELNQSLGLWDEKSKFSHQKFEQLVRKLDLITEWPKTPKGKLKTNGDTFDIFKETYPDIKAVSKVFDLSNQTKLTEFNVSEDNRYRPNGGFKMFGTTTGRCNPSTKWIFGNSKWARNFLKPSFGNVLVYLDYKSEEPFIAAQLSGDENLLEAYNSGDIYLHTAKLAGAIPEDATKQSHPEQRKIFKVIVLASNYGMGSRSMAKSLKQYGITQSEAAGLLKKYKEIYSKYFEWNEQHSNHAQMFGVISTPNGWDRRFPKDKFINPRSVINFPIQATAADVLRNALIRLCNSNIKVCAMIHDAFLIECPIPEHRDMIRTAKQCMIDAARHIVGGEIQVDEEIHRGNFKQEPQDQKIFDLIFNEIDKFKNIKHRQEVTLKVDRGTYV